MCRYCSGEYIKFDRASDYDVFKIQDAELEIEVNGYYHYSGCPDIFLEVEINYCPFCGTKLR